MGGAGRRGLGAEAHHALSVQLHRGNVFHDDLCNAPSWVLDCTASNATTRTPAQAFDFKVEALSAVPDLQKKSLKIENSIRRKFIE